MPMRKILFCTLLLCLSAFLTTADEVSVEVAPEGDVGEASVVDVSEEDRKAQTGSAGLPDVLQYDESQYEEIVENGGVVANIKKADGVPVIIPNPTQEDGENNPGVDAQVDTQVLGSTTDGDVKESLLASETQDEVSEDATQNAADVVSSNITEDIGSLGAQESGSDTNTDGDVEKAVADDVPHKSPKYLRFVYIGCFAVVIIVIMFIVNSVVSVFLNVLPSPGRFAHCSTLHDAIDSAALRDPAETVFHWHGSGRESDIDPAHQVLTLSLFSASRENPHDTGEQHHGYQRQPLRHAELQNHGNSVEPQ